jgi:hypothetical protein
VSLKYSRQLRTLCIIAIRMIYPNATTAVHPL